MSSQKLGSASKHVPSDVKISVELRHVPWYDANFYSSLRRICGGNCGVSRSYLPELKTRIMYAVHLASAQRSPPNDS